MELLEWRYEPGAPPGLVEQSTIFTDLLLHLFVHTNPSDFSQLPSTTKFVDDKGQLVRPSLRSAGSSSSGRRALDVVQLHRVKLFANEFLVGGRMLSEEGLGQGGGGGSLVHNPLNLIHLLANPNDSPRLLEFGLSVLRLVKFLLHYQHYSTAQELSDLQIALVYALSRADSSSASDDPGFVELKVLIVKALARVLDVRTNLRIAEFVELYQEASQTAAASSSSPADTAQALQQLIMGDREPLSDKNWASFVTEGTRVVQRVGGVRRLGCVLQVNAGRSQVRIRWDATTPACLLQPGDAAAGSAAAGSGPGGVFGRLKTSNMAGPGVPLGPDWVVVGPGSSPDLRVAKYSLLRELFESDDDMCGGPTSENRRHQMLRGSVLDAVMTGRHYEAAQLMQTCGGRPWLTDSVLGGCLPCRVSSSWQPWTRGGSGSWRRPRAV